MAFNIAEFKSYIEDTGVLQTNKYDVNISFDNSALSGLTINAADGSTVGASESAKDIRYRCINVSMPGLTMRTTDINRFGIGVSEKMPFSANYTDISLTFLMDRYGEAYNFWYTWFNYIFGINGEEDNKNIYGQSTVAGNNVRSFYTAEYKDNYSATITINIYDAEGNKNISAQLLKAYPVSVNDVALSWTDNNNLIKLTVSLTFREWTLGATLSK
jgi:hypothetical protein